AVLRHLFATCQRTHRLAELAHLRAGVVYVELALHGVPVEGERSRQRIAVGRVAGMTDVHRPGRVGRDELDHDPLRDRGSTSTEALTRGKHRGKRFAMPDVREKQVE